MTHCRLPEICEGYKIDIRIYDVKSKTILPRTVKERNICLYNHKNLYCVFWKKKEKIVQLLG